MTSQREQVVIAKTVQEQKKVNAWMALDKQKQEEEERLKRWYEERQKKLASQGGGSDPAPTTSSSDPAPTTTAAPQQHPQQSQPQPQLNRAQTLENVTSGTRSSSEAKSEGRSVKHSAEPVATGLNPRLEVQALASTVSSRKASNPFLALDKQMQVEEEKIKRWVEHKVNPSDNSASVVNHNNS